MLNASFPELKQTLLTFFFVGTFEIRLDYEQSLFFLGPSSKTPETRKLLNLKKKRDSSQSKIRQFPKQNKKYILLEQTAETTEPRPWRIWWCLATFNLCRVRPGSQYCKVSKSILPQWHKGRTIRKLFFFGGGGGSTKKNIRAREN